MCFEQLCNALATIAKEFQDIQIIYPVHLNHNIREPVNAGTVKLVGTDKEQMYPL